MEGVGEAGTFSQGTAEAVAGEVHFTPVLNVHAGAGHDYEHDRVFGGVVTGDIQNGAHDTVAVIEVVDDFAAGGETEVSGRLAVGIAEVGGGEDKENASNNQRQDDDAQNDLQDFMVFCLHLDESEKAHTDQSCPGYHPPGMVEDHHKGDDRDSDGDGKDFLPCFGGYKNHQDSDHDCQSIDDAKKDVHFFLL